MRVGREMEETSIRTDSGEGRICSPKVIVYNIYSGEVRVGGDNGVGEGIDGGKGGCVDPYIVFYVYLVSTYSPSRSPLPQSVHFVPLLFYYSFKIGGGLGGTDDRKEAL